ncbi:Predicted thiol-disulfide oxidoreductase YuxK, DCC family [Tenacibaculum sp. MAR_2009_124]|uniref:thiol-disulfide oxidoreductase DCC family protein n=1 Tax=Tenacibaculum sp. MAR_2009_124 TaxID=1250059 RepID=UPI00089CCF54|nr:DCC1-like thiol-disulfide oxidoreductase family protein [Tenacibaculum sp. MAR_2009_124]SED23411.1 Predicted thiol-disulfide oxidoreductase YuxK, DCC family [Tenacibaculum sp. MAR_2009_124]
MLPDIPENKQLILFDGVCNLCNSSVQFVIKNDKKNSFLFASLQGDTGLKIIDHFNIDRQKTDSILLFTPEKKIYSRSKAALLIASKLKFPLNLLSIFLVIPSFIRDIIYDYIAKNRYKWYGKKDACYLPTLELKSKFLS